MFYQKPRDERRGYIFDQFNFVCSCCACENDFPLAGNLRKIGENFVEPSADFDQPRNKATQIFKSNCDYIDRNFADFPCYEICRLMQFNCKIVDHVGNISVYGDE